MGGAADLAAVLGKIAAAVDEKSGDVCIRAMAPAFLRVLRSVTPVESGRLRASETIDSMSSGGRHGEAEVAPHTVYAHFRNYGGTIRAKHAIGHKRGAHVNLSDRRSRSDSYIPSHAVLDGFLRWGGAGGYHFARQVTQAGSFYMEKAIEAAPGPCGEACSGAISRLIAEAGG